MTNNYSFNYSKNINFPSVNDFYKKNILLDEHVKKIKFFRKEISNIINNNNHKFLLICGPCSIHNINESIEYANFLKKISLEVSDYIYIIMRVYLEKPRTSTGWKGFINDPNLNGSDNIELGINKSIEFLFYLLDIELPAATELLNPIIFRYISDLISWVSIGARTSESQIHREFCSSLNIPIGFKNNTNGNVNSAINSIKSCNINHTFLNINNDGVVSLQSSSGNKNCSVILRGGLDKPNYNRESVEKCLFSMEENSINKSIIIDCSHDNSLKISSNQKSVLYEVMDQIINYNQNINGAMIESYINSGCQNITTNNNIKYGISITDDCIGIKETEEIIYNIYNIYKKYITNL